jgi:hypothetical protein
MLAGIVASALAQSAATNQTGDDGVQTKAYIDSHHFSPTVSAMRLPPTHNGRVRERDA